MAADAQQLTNSQLRQLAPAFHRGASEASAALAQWLTARTTMTIDSIAQCHLELATGELGESDTPICMCLMEMEGTLTGHMLLAFDDASGLAIANLLVPRSPEMAANWGEVEISCVLETMNIAGSAYLNGIAEDLSVRSSQLVELLPSPPRFLRDYAESLLQASFMDQALAAAKVVFAKARFDMSGQPVRWTFLLIPDPASLKRLSELLAALS